MLFKGLSDQVSFYDLYKNMRKVGVLNELNMTNRILNFDFFILLGIEKAGISVRILVRLGRFGNRDKTGLAQVLV